MPDEGRHDARRFSFARGVSGAVLRLWRSENKGPRYFRAGEKLVRYRKADLDTWIEARLSTPATSAA